MVGGLETVSIFELEVKEKKSQAYNNRARSGTKGGSKSRKGMSTPYDFMTTSQKKELNGKVEVFNMYETVLTISEFELKSEETQKDLLTRWRDVYDNDHIKTELGISYKHFYELVKRLDIPKKTRIETTSRTGKAKQAKSKTVPKTPQRQKQSLLDLAVEQVKIPEQAKEESVAVLTSKGWTLAYNNIYSPEELSTIFTKAQLMVEGEKRKFELSFTLTEIR